MKSTLLFYIIILLVVTSCQKIQEPEFKKLDQFGIKKLGFTDVVIGFETVYYNPNKFGVTVKEADVDVYVNDVFLGKFNQPVATQVGGKSDFTIPLEGNIPLKNALQLNGKDVIKKPVSIRASGNVKVGKAGVFINQKINYEGRHRLDSTLLKNPAAAGLFN